MNEFGGRANQLLVSWVLFCCYKDCRFMFMREGPVFTFDMVGCSEWE